MHLSLKENRMGKLKIWTKKKSSDDLYRSLFIKTTDILPFYWVNCKTLGFIDSVDDWGFQGTI